jgi:hypothetical protein
MLNRSAVVIRYREAFRDWLRSIGVEEEEFEDHADRSYCQELCLEVLDQAAFCRTPSVNTFPSRTRTIW